MIMMQMSNDMEFPIGEYLGRYRGQIVALIIVVAILAVLSTTFYMIDADSEGVVLRFGRYHTTTAPGLHGKLPWPIDMVYEVPVRRIQSLEFGFATAESGRVTQFATPTKEHKTVGRMLTGDLNLTHVEWIVQYRIKDAKDYLFKIGGHYIAAEAVADIIRNVSEAVMRKLVGDASVDEVITIGRDQIATDAKVGIQEMLDGFEAGVEIVTVKLQSATPPEAVKDAFDEVNRARQNKERVINDARGERNRQIPAARGTRDRVISEAEGYYDRVVLATKGRANAFLAQLAEYEKAPDVTRTRLYIEAMENVLSQVDSKIVIDESIRGLLPLLNVDAAGTAVGKRGGAR